MDLNKETVSVSKPIPMTRCQPVHKVKDEFGKSLL